MPPTEPLTTQETHLIEQIKALKASPQKQPKALKKAVVTLCRSYYRGHPDLPATETFEDFGDH